MKNNNYSSFTNQTGKFSPFYFLRLIIPPKNFTQGKLSKAKNAK